MIGREGFLLLNGSNSKMKYIGIDPSARKDGFAVCLIKDGELLFKQYSLLDFILETWESFISDYQEFEGVVYCVENSNKQNTSYDKSGNRGVLSRKSRNVGSNQTASQLTCNLVRKMGLPIVEVSAKEKGRKWTQEEAVAVITFEKLSFTMPTRGISQDKRDALKLALMAKRYDNKNQKRQKIQGEGL